MFQDIWGIMYFFLKNKFNFILWPRSEEKGKQISLLFTTFQAIYVIFYICWKIIFYTSAPGTGPIVYRTSVYLHPFICIICLHWSNILLWVIPMWLTNLETQLNHWNVWSLGPLEGEVSSRAILPTDVDKIGQFQSGYTWGYTKLVFYAKTLVHDDLKYGKDASLHRCPWWWHFL